MGNKLKYFCLGALSVYLFIPLIETISELLVGLFEIPKVEMAKKVLKGNNEIADLQADLEPVDTYAIGFQAPTYSDEDEYYDDEE